MPCTAKLVIVAISVASAVVVIMVMSSYFWSSGTNEIDMGAGDDTSIVKESSGFHIIEVDGLGSTDGQGWSWLEIGFIILAIKLGLICSHVIHYFCLTKKIFKQKLARAGVNIEMKDVAPVVPAVLHTPALP